MTDRDDPNIDRETPDAELEVAALHGDEPPTQPGEASFERDAGPILTRESKSQGRIVWEQFRRHKGTVTGRSS